MYRIVQKCRSFEWERGPHPLPPTISKERKGRTSMFFPVGSIALPSKYGKKPKQEGNWPNPAHSGYLPQKQKLGFDGMVKWIPAGKAVELSWNTGRVLKVSEIRFGPDGDDDTNQECLEEIEAFLRKKDYGIDRMEQFSCVRDWHETMWDAAVKKWGLPTLQPVREA